MGNGEKKMSQKAERLTYQDTIDAQRKLKNLIKSKLKNNTPLTDNEKETFPKLLGDAFLAQGDIKKLYYVPKHSNKKILLGGCHQVCLQMEDINKKTIKIKNYIIQIKEVWSLIYNSFPFIFPSAIKESIHISKENPKREETSGYEFSSKNKID